MTDQDLIENFFPKDQLKITPLSGGCINSVYKVVDHKQQQFIAKINAADTFPKMLEKEVEGLTELRTNKGLNIPQIIACNQYKGLQYLFLNFIEKGNGTETFWNNFGAGLAEQHQNTKTQFGFKANNYIGSLEQSNINHKTWPNFLINERLIPQLKLAVDTNQLTTNESNKIETIFSYINELWPNEAPALLHGDLWSGNFIVGLNDQPYLIDPAVYYGHREMDIGMSFLFGGFNEQFMAVYNANFPLEKGWENRLKYNQIYPLLVHLNLFGRTYLKEIQDIIKPFL